MHGGSRCSKYDEIEERSMYVCAVKESPQGLSQLPPCLCSNPPGLCWPGFRDAFRESIQLGL